MEELDSKYSARGTEIFFFVCVCVYFKVIIFLKVIHVAGQFVIVYIILNIQGVNVYSLGLLPSVNHGWDKLTRETFSQISQGNQKIKSKQK